eukprot:gnl/TRDRNA2_/TRDRNA2_150231_c1_seq2.p1 gnl/TRDRNA2_/TRDRNA2_150231_c1~~gnl/TRDRNA2_/TRDRNA2_150231_c1_seq2.p1  ORF type:complete len:117 (+),score=7.25 gnl/TRDRNA2_/TRDRNA2_150231_c1_seq2:121-471(+)
MIARQRSLEDQGWQFRWVQVDGTDTIETADDAFELRIGSSTLSVEAMNDQNHHGVVASNGLTALAVLLIAVSVVSVGALSWCLYQRAVPRCRGLVKSESERALGMNSEYESVPAAS